MAISRSMQPSRDKSGPSGDEVIPNLSLLFSWTAWVVTVISWSGWVVIKEVFGWRKSTIPHNHSCSAFLHVSYSFLRRNFDSQAPDFPHTDACIHAFLLQVMYQLHGIAPSPRFCFSSHVSTTRHDLSCLVSPPIHVSHTRPYAPQPVSLVFMYQVECSAPHWGDTGRWA